MAVRRGYVPAQTRPYGQGNDYLRIINRSNGRHEAGVHRLQLAGTDPDPAVETAATEGTKSACADWERQYFG